MLQYIFKSVGLPSLSETSKYCDAWDYSQVDDQAIYDSDPEKDHLEIVLAWLERDPEAAFPSVLALAGLGSVRSMNHVAWCYKMSLGVSADLAQVEEWYRRAFEGGSERAQLAYAGILQARGEIEQAITVLNVGANKDWALALHRLAWYRLMQSDTKQTLLQVRPLLERAAAQGSPGARWMLWKAMGGGRFGLRKIPLGWKLGWEWSLEVLARIEAPEKLAPPPT